MRHLPPSICGWSDPALPLGVFCLLKDEYITYGLESAAAQTGYHSVSVLSSGEAAVAGVTVQAGPQARSFWGRQLCPSGNLLGVEWPQLSAAQPPECCLSKAVLAPEFCRWGADTSSQPSLTVPWHLFLHSTQLPRGSQTPAAAHHPQAEISPLPGPAFKYQDERTGWVGHVPILSNQLRSQRELQG